ncbi:hypothetical protein PG984_011530 [Apiospora sp. TS-2023a]
MASEDTESKDRGRTDPVYSDEEDDLETEYPVAPLYGVGEVVYLAVPGRTQPAGPYVVVRSSADRLYTIKRQDNDQVHGEAVQESRLLVRQ